MERNFDLIRKILIAVESLPAGNQKQDFSFEGYDTATINQHIVLLIEVGLINGDINNTMDGPLLIVSDLTWDGHDFLDAAKDGNVWDKAVEQILKPGVSFTFDLLLEWLKVKAKEKLGLS